jgi:hypothetical protein
MAVWMAARMPAVDVTGMHATGVRRMVWVKQRIINHLLIHRVGLLHGLDVHGLFPGRDLAGLIAVAFLHAGGVVG